MKPRLLLIFLPLPILHHMPSFRETKMLNHMWLGLLPNLNSYTKSLKPQINWDR
ncbi:hypothetical protein GLYMA_17G136850v4 [Glycine max]|nr:hypothetical protein GLYMA_17G136850v4 [Glycine max]KAH1118350.1 hypothetical protein GYH30_047206 [Glycine max]